MRYKELLVRSNSSNEMIDITAQVEQIAKEWNLLDAVLLLFVPHTTAAVTINEAADPDVKSDILLGLNKISPDRAEYKHMEGNSDAHLKSSLIGCSQQVIIKNGKLCLGTWQGIYFCEFDGPRSRKLYITCY